MPQSPRTVAKPHVYRDEHGRWVARCPSFISGGEISSWSWNDTWSQAMVDVQAYYYLAKTYGWMKAGDGA